MEYDVAIVGGGPGGATCGGFLKKYKPSLKVLIVEQEVFPRDHVGESQLPAIGPILAELGVWDLVEAANFPIKIGGTYRWGISDDLWDFHFLANGDFQDAPRPACFEGQRLETAFQVDRATYDKILLDHARSLGCDVMEGVRAKTVLASEDAIQGLILEDGAKVTAKHYVDASGHIGILRKALSVEIEEPSRLRNIAFWDYWENAEWAVSLGVGGTRIQVMSVGYGWLWFIPISPTRTSIGFVCPADFYKVSPLKPEQLYLKAIADEPRITKLVSKASREGRFSTTKDWSFVAARMTGPNWMLVGESAGFADPILSAGLTLTHASAREAAYTILERTRGADADWMLTQFEARNRRRILQHIKFADFWYSSNKHFNELKAFTSEIAKEANLDLDPESAFRWLGTGGFVEEDLSIGGFGTVSLTALHLITGKLSGNKGASAYAGYNGFVLNTEGARKLELPHYEGGRIYRIPAFSRDGKILPLSGLLGWLYKGLLNSPRIGDAFSFIARELRKVGIVYDASIHQGLLQCLEAMIRDGWAKPRRYKTGAPLPEDLKDENSFIMRNMDETLPPGRVASSLKL